MTNQHLDQFRSLHNTALIGFDDLINRIKTIDRPTGFPPYDIIRVSDIESVVRLAVAGYSKDQLNVVLESGILTVTGSTKIQSEDSQHRPDYIHQGISQRDFRRDFTLADTVEVVEVRLAEGLLSVFLRNHIPEYKKSKTFLIK